jgi:hypothetical protein
VIKSRRRICLGHVAHIGDEKCIQNLVRIPEGRRQFGGIYRCKDNIKIDLNAVMFEDMNWILLATNNLHGQIIQRHQSLWKYSAHFEWSRNKCRYAYCAVHYERLHKGGDNSVNG